MAIGTHLDYCPGYNNNNNNQDSVRNVVKELSIAHRIASMGECPLESPIQLFIGLVGIHGNQF